VKAPWQARGCLTVYIEYSVLQSKSIDFPERGGDADRSVMRCGPESLALIRQRVLVRSKGFSIREASCRGEGCRSAAGR
jgi:hypothetical protein